MTNTFVIYGNYTKDYLLKSDEVPSTVKDIVIKNGTLGHKIYDKDDEFNEAYSEAIIYRFDEDLVLVPAKMMDWIVKSQVNTNDYIQYNCLNPNNYFKGHKFSYILDNEINCKTVLDTVKIATKYYSPKVYVPKDQGRNYAGSTGAEGYSGHTGVSGYTGYSGSTGMRIDRPLGYGQPGIGNTGMTYYDGYMEGLRIQGDTTRLGVETNIGSESRINELTAQLNDPQTPMFTFNPNPHFRISNNQAEQSFISFQTADNSVRFTLNQDGSLAINTTTRIEGNLEVQGNLNIQNSILLKFDRWLISILDKIKNFFQRSKE